MTKHADSPEANEKLTVIGDDTEKNIKLITVHGTGAGDVTATGDRWWQLGSNFLKELTKRLDLDSSRVEVSPFQWELGPNSEKERRRASKRLYEELKSYDESDTDYYVVGHSHGGSVVYGALLRSVNKNNPLERLKCWCTVGTPFLDYRPNRFLFQRLAGFGLTAYATGWVSVLLGICVWINLMWSGHNDELESLQYALIVLGLMWLGGLFLYERFRKSWFTRSEKKRTSALYADRWLGLWHLEDEAISALANIKMVHAPIIPRTFLKPLVVIAQLAIVVWLGGLLAYNIVFENAAMLLNFLNLEDEKGDGFYYFIVLLFSVLGIYFGILIITYLLKFFAWLLGRPLSSVLNKVIWSSVRQRAWGDDLMKEDVRHIGSHPPEFAEKFDPLPDPVAVPLRGHSERHAILTLHKVREVLGMTHDSPSAPDLRTELNESLRWQELIHTSYFDVPEFIDLLAIGLNRAGLAELREDALLTAESSQLAAWCDGVSAT